MDKETRNAIERATQKARKLLEEDFADQLDGVFDVHRSGAIAEKGGTHLIGRQPFDRERIVDAIEHKRAAGMSAAEAVADSLRDAAFTTLNRFVALKMLEARELVQECITKGEQSSGYREFCGLAPGLPLLKDSAGYRLYIECLFDELSTEVKVLFDRRAPSSVLWPKRATFEQLLDILNANDLANVWGEDETIGWVYQYFNGQDERRKMREASQAPRNSRELAVRNQFFTPRYVVQFLTDNTLGRIWYEMRKTRTVLADRCEYMVRKPGEQFAPRAKKDPRDLRVLDPACGSGHFLLYSFDLLLTIYEEAYADPESPKSEVTGGTLAEDYAAGIDTLRAAIAGLILAHNLHGVDIDPRCAQIAQLALWMRAQRAYRDFGVARAERPRIRRANIVVAEPLIAEQQVVEEFVALLGDAHLARLFIDFVAALKFAGDLGLLLRIETLVARPQKKGQTADLFAPTEGRIRAALDAFVAAHDSHAGTDRRLFADDAVQGVGLLSVADEKFDVVLMNPPFGEAIPGTRNALKSEYGQSANDLFSAFVARALEMRAPHGVVGAITSRTGFFVSSLDQWRSRIYDEGLYLLADLGEGVMDAATVEAAAYCIGEKHSTRVLRLLSHENKQVKLEEAVRLVRQGAAPSQLYEPNLNAIRAIPNHPFAYWTSETMVQTMIGWPCFEPATGGGFGKVRKGLRTGDNFRFVRAYWEVPSDGILTNGQGSETADGWVPLVMTGASQPWFAPIFLVLNWKNAGREMRTFVLKHGAESRLIQARDFYFRPGFSWTLRAARLYPYGVPRGCIFTGSRPMAFPSEELGARSALGLFAARTTSAFIRWYAEMFARPKFAEGHLKIVPIPHLDQETRFILEESVDKGVSRARDAYRTYEPFLEFTHPHLALQPDVQAGLAFEPASLLPKAVETRLANAYGLSARDAELISVDLDEALAYAGWRTDQRNEEIDDDESSVDDAIILEDGPAERAWRIISYCVGVLFGRWDLRLAIGTRPVPPDTSVDAPLPTIPRAALRGANGEFPARSVPEGYPVDARLAGVLVQEAGAPDDIVSGVEHVLGHLGIETSELLRELDPSQGWSDPKFWRTFFVAHLKAYTLGRRKAPLYWQLATASASYSVWLYIHAFTKDTLFRVQNDYVAPKLAHEERRLEEMAREAHEKGTAAHRKVLSAQESFVAELRAFLDEVKRVAPLWNPDLDDGVIINFAPLWRLVPQHKAWQKELKSTLDTLCEEKYDWAHLAMHLWPERVVPKCATDRSLAIAHGLEDIFWVEENHGKWIAREKPTQSVESLVRERTSPAVKAALKSLLDAPQPTGKAKKSKKG